MIEAYESGEPVPIHLPGDEDNPTIFWVLPVTDKTATRWKALREWVRAKEREKHKEDTPEAVIAVADRESEEQRGLLAAQITKVENAPPDGVEVQGQEAIKGLLARMASIPLANLVGAVTGAFRLAELTFRGDDVPGTRKPKGPGRAAHSKGTGEEG
jgi:hypothetical protein